MTNTPQKGTITIDKSNIIVSKLHACLTIIVLVVWLFTSCQSVRNVEPAEHTKPNFFLYLADDLSYGDLGVTGNPYVETESIDQFARASIIFKKMYTPTAMCAPSRSALLTGMYPHKNGCHMNHGSIKKNVSTLPTYLKALGYKVALVGKRHIRPATSFPFDYIDYDEVDEYLSNVSQPVCVIYASNEPHGPHIYGKHDVNNVQLSAKWLDTPSTRNQLSGYYNDIKTMNSEFEEFVSQIQKYNLDKHAITIFTSDHGFEYFAKWSCYEAGLRVPFFMQTKGLSFNVDTVDQLTSFIDIVPTFIELAGGETPTSIDGKSMVPLFYDKTTINHPYIYGAHTTRGIYSGYAYPIRSITDGRWKYIRNLNYNEQFQNILTNGWNFDSTPTSGSWSEWLSIKEFKLNGHEWATMYQNRPYEELYDLDNDPDELLNLSSQTEHEIIKTQLSNQLDSWLRKQGDNGMDTEMAVPLKARDMTKVPKG